MAILRQGDCSTALIHIAPSVDSNDLNSTRFFVYGVDNADGANTIAPLSLSWPSERFNDSRVRVAERRYDT